MAASPDVLSTALKAQLSPLLKAAGFLPRGNRPFVRLRRLVRDEVLPWFDSVPGLAAWIVECIADPKNPVDSVDLAAALAGLGRTQRPWWISDALAALAV
jgi:hypothetical protein